MFELGKFTSHSGLTLDWKINCDGLTTEDWECVAGIVAKQHYFNRVVGVPTGGLKFAEALQKFVSPAKYEPITILCDDVLTTGKSMENVRKEIVGRSLGVVLFSRTLYYPRWIFPVFLCKGPYA